MPGLFSSITKAASYVGGAGKAGMSVLGKAAQGKMGSTAASAVWGGAAGAAWGAVSDDTSVVGGALMGAGLGAGGARYGGAAAKAYSRGGGMGRMGRAALGQMRGDVRRVGSQLMANAPMQRVRSSLKNWRSS